MTNEMNTSMEETRLEKPSLIGMILNPGIQFQRIKENPKVLFAIIIVTILSFIGTGMMFSQIDFLADPNLAGLGEDERMLVEVIGKITFIATGIFSPIIAILISTLVYFVIAKIVHSEVTFKQLFSMTTYIFLISTLGMLVNGLAFMMAGDANPEILFTSVNSILSVEGPIGAFLSRLEIFTIWGIIISALGLQIVAKFSKGLSWAVVIGIFAITTIFTMLSAGVGSMLGV